MKSMRARLRACTSRLSRNSSTKKAQGLKASSDASTTVSTGRDQRSRSTEPSTGRLACVSPTAPPAPDAAGVPPCGVPPGSPEPAPASAATRAVRQASSLRANSAPLVSAVWKPTSILRQKRKPGTERASPPTDRAAAT